MRKFASIDLDQEPARDETTILNFRHLMEKYNLDDELFRLVNVYLAESGLQVSCGAIVDATIIHAPTSTKQSQTT